MTREYYVNDDDDNDDPEYGDGNNDDDINGGSRLGENFGGDDGICSLLFLLFLEVVVEVMTYFLFICLYISFRYIFVVVVGGGSCFVTVVVS